MTGSRATANQGTTTFDQRPGRHDRGLRVVHASQPDLHTTAARPPGQRTGRGASSALQHVAQEREVAQKALPANTPRAAHTILIVDDNAALLYATVKTLQQAGFRTLQTGSGHDAVRMAKGASAMVLDINLPDLHGVEVCRLVKSHMATRIPVILTSAVYADALHREAGNTAGADAYLVAPLSPEELTSTLDSLLIRAT